MQVNNVSCEQLISLKQVTEYLPRRNGRAVHYSTVFRWTKTGVRGRRLSTIRMGGIHYTTIAQLNDFLKSGNDPPPQGNSAKTRAARAKTQLKSMGI